MFAKRFFHSVSMFFFRGGTQKYYKQEKAKIWLHYRRSLFQHIGTSSSLKGKIQKLKDKQFGKVPAFVPHRNPPARVHTNIATYKGHTLKRAYAGESFYWGLFPQAGDQISIVFDRPFAMRRYLFRSGNSEHPSDRLYNANVEVLPETAIASDDGSGIVLGHAGAPKDSASNGTLLSATTAAASTSATTSTTSMVTWAGYKSTVDGFLIVGTFDELGLAKGVLDVRVGPIREVRLRIHTESDNWAILSEVRSTEESVAAMLWRELIESKPSCMSFYSLRYGCKTALRTAVDRDNDRSPVGHCRASERVSRHRSRRRIWAQHIGSCLPAEARAVVLIEMSVSGDWQNPIRKIKRKRER